MRRSERAPRSPIEERSADVALVMPDPSTPLPAASAALDRSGELRTRAAGLIEPSPEQAMDVIEAIEQTRDHDFRRAILKRQPTQRVRHPMRIAIALVAQHSYQPEILGTLGAN